MCKWALTAGQSHLHIAGGQTSTGDRARINRWPLGLSAPRRDLILASPRCDSSSDWTTVMHETGLLHELLHGDHSSSHPSPHSVAGLAVSWPFVSILFCRSPSYCRCVSPSWVPRTFCPVEAFWLAAPLLTVAALPSTSVSCLPPPCPVCAMGPYIYLKSPCVRRTTPP